MRWEKIGSLGKYDIVFVNAWGSTLLPSFLLIVSLGIIIKKIIVFR